MKKIILLSSCFFCCIQFIYSQPGIIDSSFGTNGIVTAAPAFAFSNVAIQKDGKIVVTGSIKKDEITNTYFLARYNPDGSLDNTFGQNGMQPNDFNITSMAIQNDGKILVATNGDLKYVFARYNTDGSIDKTFGEGGKLHPTFGNIQSSAGNKVLFTMQKDDKIVVAGKGLNENGDFKLFLVRYNVDGSIDNTFNLDSTIDFFYVYAYFWDNGYPSSIAIQSDGRIVIHGTRYTVSSDVRENGSHLLLFFNVDGSLSSEVDTKIEDGPLAIQSDDKIVLASAYWTDKRGDSITLARYNPDGDIDSTFSGDGKQIAHFGIDVYKHSINIQNDKKIVVLVQDNADASALIRFNSDGSLDGTFSNAGKETAFSIDNISIFNNSLYAAGKNKLARYLLADNEENTPPTVSLTTSGNSASYIAPANIKLSATASVGNGTISKVEFYNGTRLLHTETVPPYGFKWRDVPVGNYTLTAKAYDNIGHITTSAAVHISVVPNKPPTVSIIKPKNNQAFAAPGYIHFEADAKDADGRITRVEFYSGSTLLNTQYQYPYTFVWKDLPVGSYTITAVAIDNWGAQTTSDPINVSVKPVNTTIVSNRPSTENKTRIDEAVSLRLAPNPATNILNIYFSGLLQSKPLSLSVISSTGAVMKMIQSHSSTKVVQLNVSSLVSGVYTVKFISEDKVSFRRFVKL